MRKLHLTIFSALLISGLAGCSTQNVDPSSAYYDQNDADIQAYATAKGLNGKTTNTGLYYAITQPNTAGKLAVPGEEVEFTYKSYNLSGAFVDSTLKDRPVYYTLGIQAIIAGLEEGVSLMREGESATLLIPSYLGFGNEAKTNLPPYSVILFNVQLKRSRNEDQQIRQHIAEKKLTVTDSSGTGLRIVKTVTNPTGATLAAGQTITIRYLGKQLRSASAFDSTGTGTFDAVLGQNKYVKGFEEGLSKLRVGEKATILFPSSIGYGTTGVVTNNRYVITPYAPLRFDLEVVSVK
ncbi:FKBP-type peptidyl-prolyl cis-trans isomerase [Spirosoma endbachense]|uniref:Peptidyl-prolyl cis-trans isomerase n=1 Tax=Spirosoma endbachense TaxID=2666025 RepID=A0A6P1W135_9BACT|nr:FKBP-type peptidyl-prolyl cis-trans isomerase [Spirosoma endbachense]QHV98308.1 FKBP-type peptidylprolyl isomerase [Spirosoma endbachense]